MMLQTNLFIIFVRFFMPGFLIIQKKTGKDNAIN